jgi:predicted metalloendopeptidase
MNHTDYNEIFNSEFLNKVEIPEDTPKWNLRIIIEKEDHKIINNIFTKNSYVNLNSKEIDILKKFINSMDIHSGFHTEKIINHDIKDNKNDSDDDKSDHTIKEIINNIFKLKIEELLVFISENQINGIFNISTGFFNKEIYLGISEGKNNVSNTKLYKDKNFLETYKKIIKKSLELYLDKDISNELLDIIIQYELSINDNKLSSIKRREVHETINIYDIDEIKFENYNFKEVTNIIFKNADVKYLKNKIIFDEKKPFTYYNLIDKYLKEPNFRYYLSWCFLCQIGGYTFNKLNSIKFELIKIVKGINKQMNKEKKKVVISNELLGHLISKEYLSLIDHTIKPNIVIMVEYLKNTFRERLIKNTWMDKVTEAKAIEKLDNMKFVIGTDNLINFTDMTPLENNNYVKNLQTIVNYAYYYKIKFIENYVRILYGNVYDVNAYYDPTLNLMIFPYGILRPPYFYKTDIKDLNNIDKIAYNFGAIGSVIGHEMCHGFDDQGRKFDKNGNLDKNSSWWDKESEEKYKILANKIIEEYKKYNVNPNLTLGENIADVGGLNVTYHAMKSLITKNYDPYFQYNTKSNFEPEHFFNEIKKGGNNITSLEKLIVHANKHFIKAWCMIWRTKITPQEHENLVQNDVHATGDIRIKVPLNLMFKKIDDNTYIEKEVHPDEIIY